MQTYTKLYNPHSENPCRCQMKARLASRSAKHVQHIMSPASESGNGPHLRLFQDVVVLEGPLVKEIRHSFAEPWVSQVTRLYSGEPYAVVEWQVGPIPTE